MAIIVACRCGQAFEADAWLAGKVVQCPACNSPIAVPTPTPETPAAPAPRFRSAVSREDKEATESVMIFLVVGVVILVVVLCLSTFIFVYLKGSNPSTWIERSSEREQQAPGATAAQPSPPVLAAPVPPGVPNIAAPIEHPSPVAGLPESWRLFEHPTARFSALLPSSLEVIERTTETFAGNSIAHIFAASEGDHTYEASREFRTYKIASGQESATYDALVKKRLDEFEGGMMEGTANAMIDGRLVCDVRIRGIQEGQEYRKYIRLIVVDDWVLELSCRVPPGRERPAEIQAFLGTYRLD